MDEGLLCPAEASSHSCRCLLDNLGQSLSPCLCWQRVDPTEPVLTFGTEFLESFCLTLRTTFRLPLMVPEPFLVPITLSALQEGTICDPAGGTRNRDQLKQFASFLFSFETLHPLLRGVYDFRYSLLTSSCREKNV